MTRFITIAIALACLVAVPAQAETVCPVPTLYPQFKDTGECLSLQCFAVRLIRDAFRRGELDTVHLSRASECNALRSADIVNGDRLSVPCTYDYDDYYRLHAE